ncbi:O-antigen ligase family protein [Sphingomonas sp. RS6]
MIGFFIVISIGGAGVHYPVLSMIDEIVAVAALCWLVPQLASLKMPAMTVAALLLLIAVLLLPVLQLVPLPWGLWTALPGRALAAAIRTHAGLAGSASPLSLRPGATLQALLALLPPAAAFVAVTFLDARGRIAVLRALAAAAVLSAILGALQLASGGEGPFTLFDSAHRDDAIGLFVNHNHSATFLLIGIVAALVPGPADRECGGWQGPAAIGVATLLALAVLGTTSRTGLLTVVPVLLLGSYLRAPAMWRRWRLFAGLAALVLFAFALAQTPPGQTTLARFATVSQDGRQDFWANTLYAIGQFLPWGSGLGTFTTIYATVEPLDQMASPIVNHAHNDYLELALEGGLPVLVLMVAALGLTALAFVRALPRGGKTASQPLPLTIAAAGIVAILLMHSADDYPLRMPALSVPFAACIAMLFPRGRRRRDRRDRPGLAWAGGAACLAIGAALAWQAARVGMSSHFLRRDAPARALGWWPGNDAALSRLAAKRALFGDWRGSRQAARDALAQAPMDATALRAFGLAEAAMRDEAVAGRAMLLGGQLGWRDIPTQLWLIQRALDLGDPAVAVQRADAVLRQDQQTALLFGALRGLLANAGGRAALADQLALRPTWRAAFLTGLAGDARVRGADVAELYRLLAAGRAPADAAESASLLDRLWRAGRFRDARAIWQAAGGDGWIADGGFERSGSDVRGIGPFTWQPAGLLGAEIGIGVPDHAWRGRALHVVSQGIGAGAVVRQRLVLLAGAYTLRFVVRAEGGAASRPSWAIACAPGFAAAAAAGPATWSAARDGWARGEIGFTIGTDCAGQELRLILAPAHDPQSIWVDDVAIAAADHE